MKGISVQFLTGECNAGKVTFCEPFRTCTVHIGHHTPMYYPDTGTYMEAICGCGIYPDSNNTPNTERLRSPTLEGTRAAPYGATPRLNRVIDLTKYKFLDSEINKIKRRKLVSLPSPPTPPSQPDWPYMLCTGPSIKNQQACYKLTHRFWGDDLYKNYLDWYYQDPPSENDFCCHFDWLGYSYPARWIWHNAELKEPFLCNEYYEDGFEDGILNINFNDANHGFGHIPFCEPLQVFNDSGTKIGEYVGYVHTFLLNNNVWMCGNDPDGVPKYSPKNDAELIRHDRHKLVMVFEASWYLLAKAEPGQTLKSPRIAATRYWRADMLPGVVGYDSSFNPCKPYFFINAMTIGGKDQNAGTQAGKYNWGVDVKYRTNTQSEVTIFHSLTDFWIQVSA